MMPKVTACLTLDLRQNRFSDDAFLTYRLEQWPGDRTALVFLGDGERETSRLTFGELRRAAHGIAHALGRAGAMGRPVLILSRSQPDFCAAFFACLYAGAVAIPCSFGTRGREWERIAAIASDAGPVAALISREDAQLATAVEELGIPVIGIEHDRSGREGRIGVPRADAPALLQYTSGSTGSPKGVVITHGNLAANLQMISSAFAIHENSVYLTWLPLAHDMGLIGNLLAAVYDGVPCVLIPPARFYQRPQCWLSAISRFRATISGGPNFGYELCVRRFGRMHLSGLDLGSWEIAYCGAELIRPSTLTQFAERFAGAGFRSTAFYPCYGLAEATVFVSGGERNAGFKTAPNTNGARIVNCGTSRPGTHAIIVDPDSATLLPDGRTGEIWIAGPHVAAGYWHKPELTEITFRARVVPAGGTAFLRTGDLGWMRDGELYFAGRLKDLIVWRGTHLHPEDIEATVARCHTGLGGINAAFPVEIGNEEQVVVVQELARAVLTEADLSGALHAIAEAVAKAYGVHLYDAVLVTPGSVPRTTNGKVKRRRCRELYCGGGLEQAARAALRSFRRPLVGGSVLDGTQKSARPARP